MTIEPSTTNNQSKTNKDLESEVYRLSSEMETLKGNIQKRKRENGALKVLLYTGFALLLVGFIYSNTTLQRVQLQSLEANFKEFHHQILRDITTLELSLLDRTRKTVQEELAVKEATISKEKKVDQTVMMQSTLSNVNRLVSQLSATNPELKKQADSLRSKSYQLLQTLNRIDKSKIDTTTNNIKLNNREN